LIRLIGGKRETAFISDRQTPEIQRALKYIIKNGADRTIFSNVVSVAIFETILFDFVTKDSADYFENDTKEKIYRAIHGQGGTTLVVQLIPLSHFRKR
jgi:predicted transcriptional regulator